MKKLKIIYSPTFMKRIASIVFALLSPFFSFAASAKNTSGQGYYSPTFILLVSIAVFLLLAILVMVYAVNAAAKWKADQGTKNNSGTVIKTIIVLLASTAFSGDAFAQADTVATAGNGTYGGLEAVTFFAMIGIIVFEFYVLNMLRNLLMQLLGVKEQQQQLAAQKAKVKQLTLIEKLNASVSVEEEEAIMLDHEYDGIRELDNNLPPWWKYGFYVTIIWSVIYLAHYHVFKTGKLQIAEYNNEMKVAQAQLEEYRKNAANLVDENNATLLTDEGSIAEGRAIYIQNCVTCHGKLGEGGMGPNLTDDYWMHGGGVKAIFKTIKYGYPENGMKSWQQDLGARQIHMISSYIKSIGGTKPANGKAKQGTFYKEESNTETDSVKVK